MRCERATHSSDRDHRNSASEDAFGPTR
jgi:hypothetical protein